MNINESTLKREDVKKEYLGIHYNMKYVPQLEPGFIPFGVWMNAYKKGGDMILATCRQVLCDEFPAICNKVNVTLPDEKTRRVGQSVAAASLPNIQK